MRWDDLEWFLRFLIQVVPSGLRRCQTTPNPGFGREPEGRINYRTAQLVLCESIKGTLTEMKTAGREKIKSGTPDGW
ncbi:MAG: hypothetical protein DMG42_23845, partial [Acidobacteria bacterium]